MKYVSLHHHSTFSYLDGFGLPETHVKRAADLGMDALAMTEHGNISSHVRLEKAAKEQGIKPIFGCELYTNEHGRKQKRKNHLTILAENPAGYQNLLRLVTLGWSEGFYFEPTVSGRMLDRHKHGLIVLSGCLGSLLATSLVGGKNVRDEDAGYKLGLDVARRFKQAFGDSYYLECQTFPELNKVVAVNGMLEKISKKLNIPLVATGDVHYTVPEESDIQQILHNVRGGGRQTLEEQARSWGYNVKLAPPTTDQLVYKKLRATGLSKLAAHQAIANAREIADRVEHFEMPKMEPIQYPIPEGFKNKDELWKASLKWGWKYRKIDEKPNRKAYIKQLRKEMRLIEEKNFEDYFLVVADAVNFAKNAGIAVGPARGSAAASLVCYLLRITEVDPLMFPQLIFERFIDTTREDLPDIDLDFDGERRHEVRQHLVQKYGKDRVANIGTFTKYKSKNSLDDIARVYKIPKWEVEKVKDQIIERSSGDLRATETIADTVERFPDVKDVFERYPELWKSTELEGNIKGMGVHAAGIVVSNKPIREVSAIYAREVAGVMHEVVAYDKYDAEYLGMLKIDLLGLNTMGLIGTALDIIGMKLTDLYDVPLDDPETLKGFKETDVVGIFQFDGRATREACAGIEPDSFDELALINALSRPGPLHNGAKSSYIDIKRGAKEPENLHPIYNEITKDTKGEIVYQEQILRIVREVGDFSWTQSSHIRKIISQSKGTQMFNREWGRFKKGAMNKEGMDEATAKKIWDMCITSGSYAFNAAHSYSYAMLAFWAMWLKRHHPQAFYVAALQKYQAKQLRLLRDAANKGIKILPPHPKRSQATWSPDKDGLRAGFVQIPGIGDKKAKLIVETRDANKGLVKRWSDLEQLKGIGPSTVKKMREFAEQEDPFKVFILGNLIRKATEAIKNGELGKLPVPTHRAEDLPYVTGDDVEVVWLGQVSHLNLRNLWEVNQKRGEEVDPDTIKSPELDEWMNMLGEDETEIINIGINRYIWPRYKNAVWDLKLNEDLVLVQGTKPGYMAARFVKVKNLWILEV